MEFLKLAIWKSASDVRAMDLVATLPFEYRTSGNYISKLKDVVDEYHRTSTWQPLSDVSGLGWSCV